MSQDGEIFKIKNRISKDFAENISIRQSRYSNRLINNNDDIDEEILFYNKQVNILIFSYKLNNWNRNILKFKMIHKHFKKL